MDDSYEIFADHIETLDSFLRVNNYVNTNRPLKGLKTDDFFKALRENFQKNEELSRLIEVDDLRKLLSGIFYHKHIPDKKIFIYFCPTGNNNMTASVQNFLRLLCNIENCKNGVIITDRDLSPGAKKEIEKVKDNNCPDTYDVYNIKMFTDKTFVNIVENNFVPKVLNVFNSEEVKTLVNNNKVKETKLPKIIVDDPLCSFYMAKVGNIIELERDTGIEGSILQTQLVYRLVTDIPYTRKGSRR